MYISFEQMDGWKLRFRDFFTEHFAVFVLRFRVNFCCTLFPKNMFDNLWTFSISVVNVLWGCFCVP